MSKKCPESVSKVSGHLSDTLETLSGHFLDTLGRGAGMTPETLPPNTLLDTPIFGDTLSDTSKRGLSKWGLKVLVHNCPRLPAIVVIL